MKKLAKRIIEEDLNKMRTIVESFFSGDYPIMSSFAGFNNEFIAAMKEDHGIELDSYVYQTHDEDGTLEGF